MIKTFFLTLLVIFNSKAYANCAADPFSAECEASNANALKHEILCANGFKIGSNGDVKDGAGNVIANVGSVSSASKSINACKNYGGTAAYAKKDNGLTTSGNKNAVTSNSSSSGISASAASSAHIAINENPEAIVTGTSGSLGGGGDVGVSGGSGASACSSACDCPGSMDACNKGACVTITTSHPLCNSSNGVLVKGDTTCQWLCSNGNLMCPAGGQVCGGSGASACSSACDCPGSMDACDKGACVTITTSHPLCSTSGGVLVKGDATCQWLCSSGSLSCPASGQSCGSGGGKLTTTGGDFAGGGGSGNGCGPGIGTYNGTSTCCPASYPYTSSQQDCCKNAASQNICI